MTTFTYDQVYKTFLDKGCRLLNNVEELNNINEEVRKFNRENKKRTRPKYKYIASCGCESIVCFNHFKNNDIGVLCLACSYKHTSKTLKERDLKNTNMELEYNSITYFKELVKEHFEIIKCFDGCKADIIFRPLNITEDKWVGIQVKSSNLNVINHHFHLGKNYENLIILCICLYDKKIWMMPYNVIDGVKGITIGLKKSKYDAYEITKENITKKLQDFYNNTTKFDFNTLNIPTNNLQKREQEFRLFREEKIYFIKFINNDIEGLVYDFKIGDKKIQEKVGSLEDTCFLFHISKSNGRINKKYIKKQYNVGDNDFYWLNCVGKRYFYVFPEKLLFEMGYINNEKPKRLRCNPLNKNKIWYNEYLFDYENVNKEKLLKIINEE